MEDPETNAITGQDSTGIITRQQKGEKYPAPTWNITKSEETTDAYHIINSNTGVRLYADYQVSTKYDTFTFEETSPDRYSKMKSFYIHPVGPDSDKCVFTYYDNLMECFYSSNNQFVIELPQE